jgi:hypothetical protein
MSIQNRYLVPNVGTTPNNVGILAGNTVALVAGSLCSDTANTVLASVWVNPASGANTYFLNNLSLPANSTISLFGADMKHFLLNGDALWVSCNVASGFDLIISTAEGI